MPSYQGLPHIQHHTDWLSQYSAYADNPFSDWQYALPGD